MNAMWAGGDLAPSPNLDVGRARERHLTRLASNVTISDMVTVRHALKRSLADPDGNELGFSEQK